MKRRYIAWLIALALLLSACSTLPRSGGVHAVKPSAPADREIVLNAQPPSEDATAEEIVQGFLLASAAGLDDDFAVARQFLSPAAASEWNPSAEVRVYPDSQNIQRTRTETGAVRVTVGAVGTLSDAGVFTESPSDAVVSSDFSLARNADGQWRIVSLSDGIFLSEHLFGQMYTAAPLYFLSADSSSLVADLHWYPRRVFPTKAVQALLSGPSEWLEPGVSSAFPAGTMLNNAVTVSDGVAHVDLTSEALLAEETQRAYFMAQLRRTLTSFSSIKEVSVTVEGTQLTIDTAADLPVYPFGSFSLSVISDGVPSQVADNTATPVISSPDIVDLGLTDLAVGYQDTASRYAALANGRTGLFWLDAGSGKWSVVTQGTQLIRPSFDSFGWVTTGEVDNNGQLSSYAPQNEDAVTMSVPWLQGAHIRDIAVSREGSRIVVVTEVGGNAEMYVAPIARSADGRPLEIGDPVRIGQRLSGVVDVSWITPTSVVALGTSTAGSGVGLFEVVIGGPMDTVGSPPAQAKSLTSGRDEQSTVVLTGLDVALGISGRAWNSLADSVTSVALPG